MKKCTKCKQKKALSEFHKRSDCNDYQSWCKKCTSKQVVKWQRTERGKKLQKISGLKCNKKFKEKHGITRQCYYKRNDEEYRKKVECRQKTYKYLRSIGVDRKKQKCEKENCDNMAEMHHDDYDNYKDVRWLCKKHHPINN